MLEPSVEAKVSFSACATWVSTFLTRVCAAVLCCSASAATPDQVFAAKREIAQIQSAFLQEVQIATNLPRTEIDKFMPSGALYGREITEFHRLNQSQMNALRQADNRKKNAISTVREKYGISPDTARAAGSRF